MDTAAKIESWLLNGQDFPEADSMRVAYTSCLRRRPRPDAVVPGASSATSSTYPDRDWTNPNRFSDPLNRSTSSRCFPNSLGLAPSLPGRPNKAYTWYLGNELPWRVTAARARTSPLANDERSAAYSLFGVGNPSWKPSEADCGKLRRRRNGASFTWERVRQDRAYTNTGIQHYNTLQPTRPTTRAPDRLSPHATLNNTRGSPLCGRVSPVPADVGTWNGCSTATSEAYGVHLNSPRSSSSGSKGSSPSPSRHVLGNRLTTTTTATTTTRHTSPSGSSQRSSPSPSPQGTLSRLSPGLVRRYSPGLRLSPTTQHSVLGAPFGGHGGGSGQCSPAQKALTGSSFVSHWVNSSSPSPHQLSPFSARSSQTSSGREDGDASYGSETDDDFVYISCKQLSQGLADLSVTPAKEAPFNRPPRGNCVVENPTFVLTDDDDYVEDDDDDYIGCSDDALSDDVFLDNPLPSAVTKRTSRSLNASSELLSLNNDLNAADHAADHDDDAENGAVDHPAVESLRRNSLQSRLRQTWQHRRNKAAGGRSLKLKRVTAADSSTGTLPPERVRAAPKSLSPSRNTTTCKAQSGGTSPSSTAEDETTAARSPAEAAAKPPCFYYVISPTDDVNMPDVIAVRRSSVELIRWQNSLRRRRRRQAKRHDLGRNKKKEPTQSGTM